MILDLNLYRRTQIEDLRSFLKYKQWEPIEKTITEFANMSNTPIVAVAYYSGEILGFSEEIQGMIDRLTKWYKIDEVIGNFK